LWSTKETNHETNINNVYCGVRLSGMGVAIGSLVEKIMNLIY
jgi:hypothetical protein